MWGLVRVCVCVFASVCMCVCVRMCVCVCVCGVVSSTARDMTCGMVHGVVWYGVHVLARARARARVRAAPLH